MKKVSVHKDRDGDQLNNKASRTRPPRARRDRALAVSGREARISDFHGWGAFWGED